MDEKQNLTSREEDPNTTHQRQHTSAAQALRAFSTGLLIAFLTSYAVLNYYDISMTSVFAPHQSIIIQDSAPLRLMRPCQPHQRPVVPQVKKVALEAHIMSKCPDGAFCLNELIVPVMANVSDKVDFTLSFIGQLNNSSSSNDSDAITCLHGPSECLGDIISLCAHALHPTSPKIYLGFTNCLTSSYSHIPERSLIQECALEHGVDFKELNHCASKDDGAFGMELLRESVQRSMDAGVKKSCTVRLAGKVRCVRDGGRWYDCAGGHEVGDLVGDIERLAKM